MSTVIAAAIGAVSFVTSFISWLQGISSKSQTDAYNKAMAELDIEYIKKQTPKVIERRRDLGEYELGSISAVVGHSAATMEGTPLMSKQEQARRIEEDVTQITEASEHAIAGLELITGPTEQLGTDLHHDDPFRQAPGYGGTFLTRYYKDPHPHGHGSDFPHFGH